MNIEDKIKNDFQVLMENKKQSINDIIDTMDVGLLKSLISEDNIIKKLDEASFFVLNGWATVIWDRIINGKKQETLLFTHIDEYISPLDKKFEEFLLSKNIQVLHFIYDFANFDINVIYHTKTKEGTYEEKKHPIDTFIKENCLKAKENYKKTIEQKVSRDLELVKLAKSKVSNNKFICETFIIKEILLKYFHWYVNLDAVWCAINHKEEKDENKYIFTIAEIKAKTKKDSIYINSGEVYRFIDILKRTNINLSVICILTNKLTNDTYKEMALGNEDNLEYVICSLSLRDLEKAKEKGLVEGRISSLDKKYGKTRSDCFAFELDKFIELNNFDGLEYTTTTKKRILNFIQDRLFLIKDKWNWNYSSNTNNSENIDKNYKPLMEQLSLIKLKNEYSKFENLDLDSLENSIFVHNGVSYYIQYLESASSWSIIINKSKLNYLMEKGVNYILPIRNLASTNPNLNEKQKRFSPNLDFLIVSEDDLKINPNYNGEFLEICGYISINDFFHNSFKWNPSIPYSQKNYYIAKGFRNDSYGNGVDLSHNGKEKDIYILQFQDDWNKNRIDCELKKFK